MLLLLLLCGAVSGDWLVNPNYGPVTVTNFEYTHGPQGPVKAVQLSNSLISRRFVLQPTFGTIDYLRNASLRHGGLQSMFRAVEPEAEVTLDNIVYKVGALQQPNVSYAYCNRTALQLDVDPDAFTYSSHKIGAPVAHIPWKPGTRHSPKLSWPPKGANLQVTFKPPASAPPQHKDISITIYYEMYENMPLLSKWMVITNTNPTTAVQVNHATVELFAANGADGLYETHGSIAPDKGRVPPLFEARTDQAHSANCKWENDNTHSYPHKSSAFGFHNVEQGAVTPLLNCSYELGPGVRIGGHSKRGPSLATFRSLQLLHDNTDMDRMAIARYHVTARLAPWTTENPVFFHFADSITDANFKHAIDQMAAVGFEMLIYSFGTNFTLETTDERVIQEIAGQIKYAHSKGIEVGGYDLICLERGNGGYGRHVPEKWDNVQESGKKGPDACFASGWYDQLLFYVTNFIDKTGLSMLETDGPYGGEPCKSTTHEHHHDWDDSIYEQTQFQSRFYEEMRNRSVFINQPDNYFFQGGQKTGMGYNENQYSLPRWQDLTISRAGMYDDLYTHIPTQGWMFLPLIQYHAGGAAAEFSPVSEHYKAYEFALAQYLGAGVAACYRGHQLFDTPGTEALVKKWVSFYKAHRQTLISPIVHMRRADGQSWDGWIHVNSQLTEKGVAMIFNPTEETINTHIALPLYYTGLETTAMITQEGGAATKYTLQRDYSVVLPLRMAPKTVTYFVVTA
eukprot:TRINITY_DN68068_c5_g1_i1.p1 TRINITY_DN68068_c5_g1~~TRINITY_DN68068_c5_g1_i1.p1  ORF type:complete len:737 (+),score=52.82 TRINITY_DN68068_c5_g1_i1:17-2227(+)